VSPNRGGGFWGGDDATKVVVNRCGSDLPPFKYAPEGLVSINKG